MFRQRAKFTTAWVGSFWGVAVMVVGVIPPEERPSRDQTTTQPHKNSTKGKTQRKKTRHKRDQP